MSVPGLAIRAQRIPNFVRRVRCLNTYDAAAPTDATTGKVRFEELSGNAEGALRNWTGMDVPIPAKHDEAELKRQGPSRATLEGSSFFRVWRARLKIKQLGVRLARCARDSAHATLNGHRTARSRHIDKINSCGTQTNIARDSGLFTPLITPKMLHMLWPASRSRDKGRSACTSRPKR